MIKNYYETLGLYREATAAEIKLAYRTLSLKFHPDKNDGDQFLGEMFKKINEAYHILSDENKRRDYDRAILELDKTTIRPGESACDHKTTGGCGEQELRSSVLEYVELMGTVADKHEALYNAKRNPRKSIRDQAAVSFLVALICIFVLVTKEKNVDHEMGNARYSRDQSVGSAKSEGEGGFNFSGIAKMNQPMSPGNSGDISIVRSETEGETVGRDEEAPVSGGGGPFIVASSDSSITHYVVALRNLDLHAAPGTESPIVMVVPQRTSMFHMGQFVLLGGIKWANVVTGLNNEFMGWVNNDLLVPADRPNIRQSRMSGLKDSTTLDAEKAEIGMNRGPAQQPSKNVTQKHGIGGHMTGQNPFLDGF